MLYPPQSDSISSEPTAVLPRRPWRRFWAKLVDYLMLGIISSILLSSAFPTLLVDQERPFVLMVFALVPILEAAILTATGTTLGKWLLNISITTGQGDRLGFTEALQRSYLVWFQGLGMGLPIVTLVSLVVSFNQLRKNGTTPWDKKLNVQVSHGPLGLRPLAYLIAVSIASILGFVVVAWNVAKGEQLLPVTWHEAQEPEWSIKLPSEPVQDTTALEDGIELVEHSGVWGFSIYRVSYADLPGPIDSNEDILVLTGAIEGLAEEGTIVHDRPLTIQGFTGREVTLHTRFIGFNVVQNVQFIVVGQRLYALDVTHLKGAERPDVIRQFFGSFRLSTARI